MKITKQSLLQWASEILCITVTDLQQFASGLHFINIFFHVFPEQVVKQNHVVKTSLVTEESTIQADSNFSLLKYLLQAVHMNVDVIDFQELTLCQRKQVFGLLAILFYITLLKKNNTEQLEFELSLSPRVSSYLQSDDIVAVAAPQEDLDTLMSELNSVAEQKNFAVSEMPPPDLAVKELQIDENFFHSAVQDTQQSPLRQPALEILQDGPVVDIVEPKSAVKSTVSSRIFGQQTTGQKRAEIVEEPMIKSKLTQSRFSQIELIASLEKKIIEHVEGLKITSGALENLEAKQETLQKLNDKLVLEVIPMIYTHKTEDFDQLCGFLQSLSEQFRGENLQMVADQLKVVQINYEDERAQLDTISRQLKENGINVPQALSVEHLSLGLMKIIYEMSRSLLENEVIQKQQQVIATTLAQQLQNYSTTEKILKTKEVLQKYDEIMLDKDEKALISSTKSARISQHFAETVQQLNKTEIDLELLQFLPIKQREILEIQLAEVNDPAVLKIQNQINIQRISQLCQIIAKMSAEFESKEREFDISFRTFTQQIMQTKQKCFSEIEALNHDIVRQSEAAGMIGQQEAELEFLRGQVENYERDVVEKSKQMVENQISANKAKREAQFAYQQQDLQQKIMEKQQQIIKKLKLQLPTTKEESELRQLVSQQMEVPPLFGGKEITNEEKLTTVKKEADDKVAQVSQENARLTGQLRQIEKQYELLEQNYLALKRFLE